MSKDFKHISDMETILDEILKAQDSIERAIENYKSMQDKVKQLEKYYFSKQWKDDFVASRCEARSPF